MTAKPHAGQTTGNDPMQRPELHRLYRFWVSAEASGTEVDQEWDGWWSGRNWHALYDLGVWDRQFVVRWEPWAAEADEVDAVTRQLIEAAVSVAKSEMAQCVAERDEARAEAAAALDGRVIDAAHIENQRAWSTATFGPGLRLGVIDHIRKELLEVEEDPTDLSEWVDVIILGLDGAWRAGHEPQAIIDGIKAKQGRNERRSWPDWRTASPDKAIEHIDGASR